MYRYIRPLMRWLGIGLTVVSFIWFVAAPAVPSILFLFVLFVAGFIITIHYWSDT